MSGPAYCTDTSFNIFCTSFAVTRSFLLSFISLDAAEEDEFFQERTTATRLLIESKTAPGSIGRHFWIRALESLIKFYVDILAGGELAEAAVVDLGVPLFNTCLARDTIEPLERLRLRLFNSNGQPRKLPGILLLDADDQFEGEQSEPPSSPTRARGSEPPPSELRQPAPSDGAASEGEGAPAPTGGASILGLDNPGRRLPPPPHPLAFEDLRYFRQEHPATDTGSERDPYEFTGAASGLTQLPSRWSTITLERVQHRQEETARRIPPALEEVYSIAAVYRDVSNRDVRNAAAADSGNLYVDFARILAYNPAFEDTSRLTQADGQLVLRQLAPRKELTDTVQWFHCFDIWRGYVLAFYPSQRVEVLWLTHSVLFTLLFGYLHQGGLLLAIFALNRELRNSTSPLVMGETLNIVFWRTFMPPRHLLLPAGANKLPLIRVSDMAGIVPQLLLF
ncbi:hypothetical protein JCM5296_000592 [Sporobolomyces johnsonii]